MPGKMAGVTDTYLACGTGVAVDNSSAGCGESAILALAFAPGMRPGIDSLVALASKADLDLQFTISHIAEDDGNWAELLAGGLTFDCRGLAPGRAGVHPGKAALLGLPDAPAGEVVTLEPSPHLAEGGGLLPVVRALAGLGAQLAGMPGVLGAYWRPAHCWMTPKYFRGVVQDWLKGGPFPALGLTSLQQARDGAMVSVGLDYLIGQELFFLPNRRLAPAAVARIAVRLVNDLLATGPLREPLELTGPEGERVAIKPILGGRQLQVTVAP